MSKETATITANNGWLSVTGSPGNMVAPGNQQRAAQRQVKSEAFTRVYNQMESAWTLREHLEACSASREYIDLYPEDQGLEFNHGFNRCKRGAEKIFQDGLALGFSHQGAEAREIFLKETSLRGVNTYTRAGWEEMARAKQRLLAWLEQYPTDTSVRERITGIQGEEWLVSEVKRTMPEVLDPALLDLVPDDVPITPAMYKMYKICQDLDYWGNRPSSAAR